MRNYGRALLESNLADQVDDYDFIVKELEQSYYYEGYKRRK